MCDLAGVSRAGFYRAPWTRNVAKADMDLRDAMQRIALEFPSYGWPRMTAELRRRGWAVNHKRVYRLMGEDNLLCLRKRKFILTTDSNHPYAIYPNLAASMTLTGVNQLWVADITYICLLLEFVYLAVILDAFSRCGVGWALGRTLEGELTPGGFAHGAAEKAASFGSGSSLRPWGAVRREGLHCRSAKPRYRDQHESARQSFRQRDLRILSQDSEIRRSVSRGLPGF